MKHPSIYVPCRSLFCPRRRAMPASALLRCRPASWSSLGGRDALPLTRQ